MSWAGRVGGDRAILDLRRREAEHVFGRACDFDDVEFALAWLRNEHGFENQARERARTRHRMNGRVRVDFLGVLGVVGGEALRPGLAGDDHKSRAKGSGWPSWHGWETHLIYSCLQSRRRGIQFCISQGLCLCSPELRLSIPTRNGRNIPKMN